MSPGVRGGGRDEAGRFLPAPHQRVLGHSVSSAELDRGIRLHAGPERCVNDQTVSFLNVSEGESGRNGESSTVRYSFDMFRFTAEPNSFYLHCSVQLCEPDDHQSCIPSCNSISKRAAVRADPLQGLLSYGPIRIEMPHRPQSSILSTVVLPVAGVWTMGVFLIVVITVAKAGSRRLKRVEQH
ncbi:unnamed protein product [Pleuronectes platessa]|uniref:ZP domain-containing protein n=1 Tax=Pleuronectes platessa TaxID=8262 RepID=A0A9N7YFA4_PLEPL|nr:unnamed protein product [Pleuronectes platessa]